MAALVGKTERTVTDLAVEIHANLTEATPIRTGNAAANWLCSIGAPDTRVVGSPDSVDAASGPASVAETVRAYRMSMGSAFVSNHVEYLPALWDGSSAQASPGWGEAAIARAVATVAARNR
jgi:hypothetical protein